VTINKIADRNTGQSDAMKTMKLVANVTYWRRVLTSQSSSIFYFRNTCCHLYHKCVWSDDWCTIPASVITPHILNNFNGQYFNNCPFLANICINEIILTKIKILISVVMEWQ